MQKLVDGIHKFQKDVFATQTRFFERLADGQQPLALFITCSDSRIDPNMLTQTKPGELFIMRNVGNMIPPFSQRELPASGAGVDYAVGVLKVSDVVICGHSRCGAIGALRHPENVPAHLASLRAWLSEASSRKLCRDSPAHVHDDDVARANAVIQVENVRSYAIVREREAQGELQLHAWFFDIASGDLETYNFVERRWERVGDEPQLGPALHAAALDPSSAPSAA